MGKKTTAKLRNPFVYQGYISPEYFCDRIVETEELVGNLQNGRNTVLISPRRIGKTSLIKNAFYKIKEEGKDAICIYIDIFSTKNEQDFIQQFGTAITQDVLSRGQKAFKRLLEFFGSWCPVIGNDPYTGSPTVSISIEPNQSTVTLKSIFDYLSLCKQQVYIAIQCQ